VSERASPAGERLRAPAAPAELELAPPGAEPSPRPAGAAFFRRLGLATLPLLVFLGLAAVLYARLHAGDAARLPSALIGRAAPALDLPGLDGGPGLVDSDLRQGHVTLVNVFASWCQPCHVEHEFLLALASDPTLKAEGVTLVGVAQRDSPENIRRFLGAAGDPYAKVGLDSDDRAGIDWGVYGVPETFIVRGDGVIAYKAIGPINAETLETVVKPEIAKAMK
jgi:cytochrome c biogenesis protein CcmG, thiol:disulfide interchange protein DsbE